MPVFRKLQCLYVFVGRNEVIAALRKKIKDSAADVPENIADDVLLPDMQLEFKEMHQLVLDAIERLPAVRKRCLR